MTIPQLFARSVDEFTRRVDKIADDQWDNPTPCTEWSVRDLVNHMVTEDLWAPGLLTGKTIDDMGGMEAFEGDHLGDDPKAVWLRASQAATAAVHRDGAMDEITHLSFGDFPGSFYTQQLLGDHVIHAWDLARGIHDDDSLDPELVDYIYEGLKPYADSLSAGGSFKPPVEVPESVDTQTKLLALVGRRR